MDARRIGELMEELGRAATEAAAVLALAPGAQKNAALVAAAQAVRARAAGILAANERDVAAARARQPASSWCRPATARQWATCSPA